MILHSYGVHESKSLLDVDMLYSSSPFSLLVIVISTQSMVYIREYRMYGSYHSELGSRVTHTYRYPGFYLFI